MTFMKLNSLSALYAFVFFVQTELMLNVYRIARITGWNNNLASTAVNLAIFLVFALSSILCYFSTKKLLGIKKIKYISSVLWIPYYFIFIKLFSSLFPITNPQEMPLPGVGLVVIAALIIYPFYISLINFLVTIRASNIS
ncbi:hypothetical protein [Paenibacillus caui]|uniref:hypothetical protein n=1 Tax=Paenibacillus caui TaxID=2873927 RepID=UPI001CA8F3D7|nr:hypothetical protein [Paenibacillus caui]